MKLTVPKLSIGSCAHWPALLQADGASWIHSAVETSGSGELIVNVFLNVALCVRFRSRTVTRLAFTVTATSIVSPGLTVIVRSLPGAGTSSYQAEYLAWPPVQSNSVPVCSSALE